jgi:hypothetical protein
MLTRGYSGARAYCQSKLAQIMVRRAGVRPLGTVEEGARAILNLATSPAVAGRPGFISTACGRQERTLKPMMQRRVGASRR